MNLAAQLAGRIGGGVNVDVSRSCNDFRDHRFKWGVGVPQGTRHRTRINATEDEDPTALAARFARADHARFEGDHISVLSNPLYFGEISRVLRALQ